MDSLRAVSDPYYYLSRFLVPFLVLPSDLVSLISTVFYTYGISINIKNRVSNLNSCLIYYILTIGIKP